MTLNLHDPVRHLECQETFTSRHIGLLRAQNHSTYEELALSVAQLSAPESGIDWAKASPDARSALAQWQQQLEKLGYLQAYWEPGSTWLEDDAALVDNPFAA